MKIHKKIMLHDELFFTLISYQIILLVLQYGDKYYWFIFFKSYPKAWFDWAIKVKDTHFFSECSLFCFGGDRVPSEVSMFRMSSLGSHKSVLGFKQFEWGSNPFLIGKIW